MCTTFQPKYQHLVLLSTCVVLYLHKMSSLLSTNWSFDRNEVEGSQKNVCASGRDCAGCAKLLRLGMPHPASFYATFIVSDIAGFTFTSLVSQMDIYKTNLSQNNSPGLSIFLNSRLDFSSVRVHCSKNERVQKKEDLLNTLKWVQTSSSRCRSKYQWKTKYEYSQYSHHNAFAAFLNQVGASR